MRWRNIDFDEGTININVTVTTAIKGEYIMVSGLYAEKGNVLINSGNINIKVKETFTGGDEPNSAYGIYSSGLLDIADSLEIINGTLSTDCDAKILNTTDATANGGYLTIRPKEAPTPSYSGGSASYPVSVSTDIANGKLTVDKKNASAGETVTVTVAPDKGLTLETITVLDKTGKEVEVKNIGDNKFSFRMPSGKITISATFMEDNSI